MTHPNDIAIDRVVGIRHDIYHVFSTASYCFFSGIALKKVEQKQEADKAAAAGAGGSSGGKGGPGGHGTDVASILARRRAVEVTIWIGRHSFLR